jgi:hypothetical protein
VVGVRFEPFSYIIECMTIWEDDKDLHIVDVERLLVLRRVARKFKEGVLDLRVPLVLGNTRSMIVLSCGLYNF